MHTSCSLHSPILIAMYSSCLSHCPKYCSVHNFYYMALDSRYIHVHKFFCIAPGINIALCTSCLIHNPRYSLTCTQVVYY